MILTAESVIPQNGTVFKTSAILVLLLSSAAAQTSGVLIGFSTFDDKRGEGETPKQPSYHTLWITHSGPKPQLVESLDVLLIPTDEGWKRLGTASYCTDFCQSGYYALQNLYLVGPHEAAQLRPTDSARCRRLLSSGKTSRAEASYSVSAVGTDRVYWVNPSYISHISDSSEFEPCEARGNRERVEAIVSELGHDMSGKLEFTQVPGKGLDEALALAFEKARKGAAANGQECPADIDMGSLSDWYIRRTAGEWRAFAYQWWIPNTCLLEAKIEAPLPENFVGQDHLAVPFETLRKIYPKLQDAFSSPLGDMLVLRLPGELHAFEMKDGVMSKEFTTIPLPDSGADTVMIQWALNKFVSRWTAEIKQMKAAGFPKPILR